MKKILPALAIALTATLLCQKPFGAQLVTPAKKTSHVQITEGPALESAQDTWAIITWRSSSPGGSDEHFGVVHYGTDPKDLSQTAKSHIRLNQQHSYTVFRVRVLNLQPHTTYYYTVDSMEANGTSDGVVSRINNFTTR
jgi:hypothetical protein